jgi:hypothetical protein
VLAEHSHRAGLRTFVPGFLDKRDLGAYTHLRHPPVVGSLVRLHVGTLTSGEVLQPPAGGVERLANGTSAYLCTASIAWSL